MILHYKKEEGMKTKEAASIPQKKDEKSRREFLIKAGKMALYIPPAMMVLMHPSRNALACSPRPPRCGTNGYQPSSFSLFSGGGSGGGGYTGGGHHHHHHHGGPS